MPPKADNPNYPLASKSQIRYRFAVNRAITPICEHGIKRKVYPCVQSRKNQLPPVTDRYRFGSDCGREKQKMTKQTHFAVSERMIANYRAFSKSYFYMLYIKSAQAYHILWCIK